MRHGKTVNHLSRQASHRQALMRNMTLALIEHKRINTTVPKAKALRRYVEPLLTKAKSNTTHSRRVVFSYLQNNKAINELFGPIAAKIADRPGGYTRILRTGFRPGDSAEMCFIELVDFNTETAPSTDKKAKRTRRGRSKKAGENNTTTTETNDTTEA
jgi:large subunit ribosomal protein L17